MHNTIALGSRTIIFRVKTGLTAVSGRAAGLAKSAAMAFDGSPALIPVHIFEAPKRSALPAPVNPPAEGAASKARREAHKVAWRGGMEISLPNGSCCD